MNYFLKKIGRQEKRLLTFFVIFAAVSTMFLPIHKANAQFDGSLPTTALANLADAQDLENAQSDTAQAQASRTQAAQAAAQAQQCAALNTPAGNACAKAETTAAADETNLAAQYAQAAAQEGQTGGISQAVEGSFQTAYENNATAQANAAAASAAVAQSADSTAQAAVAAGEPAVAAQAAVTAQAASQSSSASAAGAQAASQAAAAAECSGIADIATNFGPCVLNAIAYFLFQLAATILGFIGLLFNWVVVVSVFEFGIYFANSAGMLAAWGILRDIGNIVLLFGFIFMGIMMILDLESFNVRRALPRLLIFAVLLNFSLFASEAVVDVANALTAGFYQVAGAQNCASGGNNNALTTCTSQGITGDIITASGLSTVWTNGAKQAPNTSTDGALIMVMEAIFFIIAAMVLLAGAIMLGVRAITLAFLLVVSPLGFAGMAIPPLQKQANAWWNKLLSEAFFAPVFLLLIFVGLKLTSILQPTGDISFNGAIQGNAAASAFGVIFLFALVMGFMIAALVVAKNMGAAGANIAISTSTKLAGAATFGTTGFIARRTVGAGSNTAAKYIRKIAPGEMGRLVASPFDKLSKSSFDARSTAAIQGLAKNKAIPVDFGKVSKTAKGGMHEIEKQATKARTDYADSLHMTDEEIKNAPGFKEVKARLLKDQLTTMTRLNKAVEDATDPATNAAARKARDDAKEKYAKELEKADDAIINNDPKLRYARNLKNSPFPSLSLLPFVGIGRDANLAAAKAIEKDVNTGAIEKMLKKILDEEKKGHAEEREDPEEEVASNASGGGGATTGGGGNGGGGGGDHRHG